MISYFYFMFALTDEIFPFVLLMFLVVVFFGLENFHYHFLESLVGDAEFF